jgi:hypothetical protein
MQRSAFATPFGARHAANRPRQAFCVRSARQRIPAMRRIRWAKFCPKTIPLTASAKHKNLPSQIRHPMNCATSAITVRTLQEQTATSNHGSVADRVRHGSSKAGKSVTLAELRALTQQGRSLIVYHHHTPWAGGHHGEIDYWAGRLRQSGFQTVDALGVKPFSPRVFFELDDRLDWLQAEYGRIGCEQLWRDAGSSANRPWPETPMHGSCGS